MSPAEGAIRITQCLVSEPGQVAETGIVSDDMPLASPPAATVTSGVVSGVSGCSASQAARTSGTEALSRLERCRWSMCSTVGSVATGTPPRIRYGE